MRPGKGSAPNNRTQKLHGIRDLACGITQWRSEDAKVYLLAPRTPKHLLEHGSIGTEIVRNTGQVLTFKPGLRATLVPVVDPQRDEHTEHDDRKLPERRGPIPTWVRGQSSHVKNARTEAASLGGGNGKRRRLTQGLSRQRRGRCVGAVIVAEGNAGENNEQRQVLPCPDVLITPILVLEQG